MYFSPKSWGELSKSIPEYTKRYSSVFDDDNFKLTLTQESLNDLLQDISFSNTNTQIMKQILEVLSMPVTNPKTGEQDFVDLSLVDKIQIDPEYIFNMATNKREKVNIALSSDAETNQVLISTSIAQDSIGHVQVIPLQSFEEMLFDAIHNIESQRLEESVDFKGIVQNNTLQIIQQAKRNATYLSFMDKECILTNGVGMVRDIKTDQQVGTFESIEYIYKNAYRNVSIKNLILSGRSLSDLEDNERYEFKFYSLEDNLIYSLLAIHSSSVSLKEEDSVDIKNFNLELSSFDPSHESYKMAVTSNQAKELIAGLSADHPLYDRNLQEFRNARLQLLEESKQKQKKAKMVSQFADIDLDF